MKITLELLDTLPDRNQVVFLAKAVNKDGDIIQVCQLFYTVKSTTENIFKEAAKQFNASLREAKQRMLEQKSLLEGKDLSPGTVEVFEEEQLLVDLDEAAPAVALYTPAQEEFIKQKIVSVLDDLGFFYDNKTY